MMMLMIVLDGVGMESQQNKVRLECRTPEGTYKLINGKLYFDKGGRQRILSFCLKESTIIVLPIFVVE